MSQTQPLTRNQTAPQRSSQHLWLLLRNTPEHCEVTELVAENGAGRSYQYHLALSSDRLPLLSAALCAALRRCTYNAAVLLHSPHTEYVRMADRSAKRPPELSHVLKKHNLTLGLARRNNGVALFAAYAEALADHSVPELPGLIDYQLYTACVTDGVQSHVGAVLCGRHRVVTWRNSSKGSNLTLAELHGVRWALTTVPEGSRVEIFNQSPDARTLWTDAESVMAAHEHDLKPYMLKVGLAIQERSLGFQGGHKRNSGSLYTEHARLLAGTQYAETSRERRG